MARQPPGGMLALYWIILGISIAAMWILFTKAHEEGWASIVPFYNMYVASKITWGSGWLFLLLLIPIADIVIWIITMVKLAQVFGKGGGFACGLIFLNTIFECIIAFDNSIQYVGINGEYANGDGGGFGPTGGFGGSSAQEPISPSPAIRTPTAAAPKNTTRQSSANDQYYYRAGAAPPLRRNRRNRRRRPTRPHPQVLPELRRQARRGHQVLPELRRKTIKRD